MIIVKFTSSDWVTTGILLDIVCLANNSASCLPAFQKFS
jgi:hypothetical protein